jgi:hypothetical protein
MRPKSDFAYSFRWLTTAHRPPSPLATGFRLCVAREVDSEMLVGRDNVKPLRKRHNSVVWR